MNPTPNPSLNGQPDDDAPYQPGWFLSPDERRLIAETPETGFVPEFIEWAGLKTGAPPYGLRAGAYCALSLAAGDVVVVEDFFDDEEEPLYLNLYILLIGPSTTMRKTSIMKRVRRLIPVNDQSKTPILEVLDDVSVQAFNKAAAQAGQRKSPVLFQVDEIAGLFQLTRNKTGYMAGFDKNLLTAYDHSPITIHRTNAKIDAPAGAFVNVFGASTPEPLLEVLSQIDVESGLLPRFLIFDLTDAARGPRISLQERRANSAESEKRAEKLKDHLYRIGETRFRGVPLGLLEDGAADFGRTIIKFSPEAVDRLEQLDVEIEDEFQRSSTGAAAIGGRAYQHIHKLSGLNALSRMDPEYQTVDQVEADFLDVLRAIELVQDTVADTFRMQQRFGENQLERQIQEVVRILRAAKGNKVKSTTLVNRLKLDFYGARNLLGTLTARGIANGVKSGPDTFWSLSKTTVQAGRLEALTTEVTRQGQITRTEIRDLFDRNIGLDEIDLLVRMAVATGNFKVGKGESSGGRKPEILKKI